MIDSNQKSQFSVVECVCQDEALCDCSEGKFSFNEASLEAAAKTYVEHKILPYFDDYDGRHSVLVVVTSSSSGPGRKLKKKFRVALTQPLTVETTYTLDRYQTDAKRITTLDQPLEARLTGNELPKIGVANDEQWVRYQDLTNAVFGLCGETGEIAEMLKKHLFHGKPLYIDLLKKELGDVLWHLAFLASIAGLSLSEIAEANVEQLKLRYPNGFSQADISARRDLKGGV